MKKNLIGWMIVAAGILLAACEREETDSLVETTDGFRFSIPLTLTSQLQAGDPEYVPITTKAGKGVRAVVAKTFRYLVIKELNDQWYVDQIKEGNLEGTPYDEENINIMSDGLVGNLDVTLRPGKYRILVVLNPEGVKWNPDLIPGYWVKTGSTDVPYAITYPIIVDEHVKDKTPYEGLSNEIFTGTCAFTVSKTGDLHSDPLNGNDKGAISLTRKVSRFRICLKDRGLEWDDYFNERTAHTATFRMIATDDVFCDGIDCWGDAYYDKEHPRKEHFVYKLSTNGNVYDIKTKGVVEKYQLVMMNSTYYHPFIFIDEKKTAGIPYQIESFTMSGQSGGLFSNYKYDGIIDNHILYPNSIDGVVLQTKSDDLGSAGVTIKLERVPDRSDASWFDEFYEVENNPKDETWLSERNFK